MPAYNPAIIEKYAANLYARGSNIIWRWGCLGMAAGAYIAHLIVDSWLPIHPQSIWGLAILAAGVVVGLFVGRSIGTDRAFSLFLQAQTALCQVAIERNTRRPNS